MAVDKFEMMENSDSHYRLLVVDDEEDVRRAFMEVLEQNGSYQLFEAEDGIEAMEILGKQEVDLVISDVRMPRMDGIALLQEIKKLRPDLPVIIMTSFGGDIGVKVLSLGADDIVTRPFKVDEFELRIERTLRYYQRLKTHRELEAQNKELWRRAISDGLTGLYNRHHFDELFEMEFQRSKRYRTHLGCLMFDIDDFKNINDDYGHLVGDAVLHDIGQLIRETLRKADTAARYGGEEFVVLFPETTREGILFVGERLRESIEEFQFCKDFSFRVEPIRTVTISLGATYFPDSQYANPKALLQAADDALYRAKGKGKNRLEKSWD